MKIEDLLPKAIQTHGSVHLEFKTCGSKGCRCAGGMLHGPYAVFRWRENSVQKKRYIPMNQIIDILVTIQERKDERADIVEAQRTLKAFKVYSKNR